MKKKVGGWAGLFALKVFACRLLGQPDWRECRQAAALPTPFLQDCKRGWKWHPLKK